MRRFIIVLAAMASVGLLGTFGIGDGLFTDNQRADAQTTRPNFVFVLTDDLDERAMDYLPGIREVMGAKGITFKNAYVTYSLCCPSRATILRGQYPHNHGIIGNAPPEGGEPVFRQLKRDQSTIATWLDDAGYRTKLIGKYMNVYNDLYVPPGWDEWYALKQDSGPYGEVVDKPEENREPQWTTLGGHSAYVFANKASDFISRSHNSSEPFFLMVNSVAPHEPPEVAAQYSDRFTTTPLPTRTDPNFNEADISDKPQWIKSNYPTTFSQTKISNLQNAYRERLRSMLSVEDMLKQIVTTLEQTGELENTYIFFTSDNGYHFGNHRFGANKNTPYEEDIGVPLMVRGPGVPAAEVRKQLVLNNDFAPTIVDLAGASLPTKPEDGFEVDGSSFAPLLTNSPPSTWRQAFLEEGWLGGGKMPTPTHKSVHTQDHMFNELLVTGEHELYDLVVDPYQLQSKPRAGNEQLYSALGTRLNALKACSGAGCRAAEWDATPPPSDDTTPPRVKSTSPANGATLMAPGVNVTATFTEAMDASTTDGDPSTINSTTFKLMKAGTTTAIGAVVSYDPTTKTATLNPNANLQLGTKYKAVVTTGAQDVAGNGLDQNSSLSGLQQKAWTFTVSP